MRRSIFGALFFLLVAQAATTVLAQDEIYKWEFYGGYSYMNLNRGFDPDEFNDDFEDLNANRVHAHGIELAFNYNFSRYLGAKFAYTRHAHSQDLLDTSTQQFKLEQKVGQFLGGIQIKDNKKDGGKLKPFAHILVGGAQQSIQGEGNIFVVNPRQSARAALLRPEGEELVVFDINSTDFTMSFGGGLDLRIHKNIDIRLAQFDWNPIFRGDRDTQFGTFGGAMQNNLRFGVGVVVH
jgi:opacity protein-like surface antigen